MRRLGCAFTPNGSIVHWANDTDVILPAPRMKRDSTFLQRDDLDGDRRVHLGVKVNPDFMCSHAPDGLLEMDPLPVDVSPHGFRELLGDVLRGDAPKQLPVLAGLPGQPKRLAAQLRGEVLGHRDGLPKPLVVTGFQPLGVFDRALAGGDGYPTWQQVVARVSVGDVDDLPWGPQ